MPDISVLKDYSTVMNTEVHEYIGTDDGKIKCGNFEYPVYKMNPSFLQLHYLCIT